MSARNVSRELAKFQRRLALVSNGDADFRLAREDVAVLIEELQSTIDELNSANCKLEEKTNTLELVNTDLQHFLENVGIAAVLLDAELRIKRFTASATRIFPLEPRDRGRRLTDLASKLRDVDLAGEMTRALRSGDDIQREVTFLADHEAQRLLMHVRPGRKLDGAINGVVLSFVNAKTNEVQYQNALRTRELGHRIKNLLFLVHSTVVQTAQHSTTKDDFIQTVDERLKALLKAHDLLIMNDLKSAAVGDLVRSCLKPFIVDQRSLETQGARVLLRTDVVHTLSLVLHELATNALKYGALTRAGGKILVSWALDHDEFETARFRISWREVDGPPAVSPERTGFGTQLISEAPRHELGARVVLDYPPTGVYWSLDMPAIRAIEEPTSPLCWPR